MWQEQVLGAKPHLGSLAKVMSEHGHVGTPIISAALEDFVNKHGRRRKILYNRTLCQLANEVSIRNQTLMTWTYRHKKFSSITHMVQMNGYWHIET